MTLLIVLGIIFTWFLVGFIWARLSLPILWQRAKIVDANRKKKDEYGDEIHWDPTGYVNGHAATIFLFWPIAGPIASLSNASHKLNPNNLAYQPEQKAKNEKRMQREINSLEKANDMELTKW